jgi:peptide deformylase
MKLVPIDHPVLHKVCQHPFHLDSALEKTVAKMAKVLKASKGVGLAAPQVGLDLRVFLTDVPNMPGRIAYLRYNGKSTSPTELRPLAFVSPEVELLGNIEDGPEGCLSLPGQTFLVPRHEAVRVTAFHADGRTFTLETKGFFARVIQHEFDHLNGILISERGTPFLPKTQDAELEETLKAVSEKWNKTQPPATAQT